MGGLVLSLTGADEDISSTAVLNLFPRRWPLKLVGGLSPEVDDIVPTDACVIKDTCSYRDDEIIVILAQACHQRVNFTANAVDIPSDIPAFALDRSSQMYKAVCIARIMDRHNLTVEEAEGMVDSVLADNKLSFPNESLAILLRKRRENRHTRSRSLSSRSQQALRLVLERQIAQGIFREVIDIAPAEPLIETLSNVTACLQARAQDYIWRPLLENIKVCIAFSGLSQCGKSSMCAVTTRNKGETAFRLRASYISKMASQRLGRSLYDLPAHAQATEFVHELDAFAYSHQWLQIVTLDSLQDYAFARHLAQLLGNGGSHANRHTLGGPNPHPYSNNVKLMIVYIDTPLELRMQRTLEAGGTYDHAKDKLKIARGAHEIKHIADIVVKNDGTLESTFEEVWEAAEKYGPR